MPMPRSVRPPSPPAAPRKGADAEARPRGRPPVISNERLLEIARAVFLEHGIGATTLEVASRAGVAEGTIFHRFRSKEELFRAAMQFEPEQALAFIEALPSAAGQGDLRATLVRFAEQFIELGRVGVPVMMMSWSNPEMHLESSLRARAERYRRVVGALREFFAAEMRAGRLAGKSPELLARMLLGSLHHYCMSELLAREVGGLGAQAFASGVVDVLLASARAPSSGEAADARSEGTRT